nr:hypothetical protein [Gordonia polyisoprenivorans]
MAVALEQRVVDQLQRIDAGGAGSGAYAFRDVRVAVRWVAEDEQLIVLGNDVGEERVRIGRRLRQQPQPCPQLAQLAHLLRQRQRLEFPEGGVERERVQAQLETEQAAGRAGNHLSPDLEAVALGILETGEDRAPLLLIPWRLHEGEGDLPAAALGDPPQQVQLHLRRVAGVRHELEDARPGVAQGEYLLVLGVDRRRRPAGRP